MSAQDFLKSRWGTAGLVVGLYAIGTLLARTLGIGDMAGLDLGGAGIALAWGIGHCDGMDGPVVTLAKKALDSGNVNLVLPWVRAEDEHEIRRALEHALAVR